MFRKPYTIPIYIYITNRIIRSILIRRQSKILLSKSVLKHKSTKRSIIMSCTVIIPVQALLGVKFLAIIFVRLHITG